MFDVDISQAVFFYVTFSLVGIFLVWVFSETKTIHPRFVREKADVWLCSICAYNYVDSRNKEISRCPQMPSRHKLRQFLTREPRPYHRRPPI